MAVVVDKISPTSVSMKVVNLNQSASRQLVIQAGSFGEHRFVSVVATSSAGKSESQAIGGKYFAVDLAAGAGATLDFVIERYVNKPSYETPWQKISDWDPLIVGRPASNFK